MLLLALHFRRPLILSDLPSFRETLRGFTDDMFFQPDSAESLSRLIIRYIDGEIDRKYQLQIIEQLNKVYSWVTSAEKTFELYKTVSISS